jgi:hypothetical protein
MKKFSRFALLVVLALAVHAQSVWAGPPLVNLEGVGGIAFNPLAYPADSTGEKTHLQSGKTNVIGEPRLGAWYVNLHQPSSGGIDWTAIGAADTLFNRLEISYGYEAVAVAGFASVHKTNLGAKLLLVPENALGTKAIPAVSVGLIHKSSEGISGPVKFDIGKAAFGGPDTKSNGNDFYLVATKLITQLPRPVLLSGGLLLTDGYATGVLGYDKTTRGAGFGNVDIVWPLGFATGFEYQQGAKFGEVGKAYRNPNYYDVHLAWFATPNITAVLAYVNAGNAKSTDYFGLGAGTVLSLQHTF